MERRFGPNRQILVAGIIVACVLAICYFFVLTLPRRDTHTLAGTWTGLHATIQKLEFRNDGTYSVYLYGQRRPNTLNWWSEGNVLHYSVFDGESDTVWSRAIFTRIQGRLSFVKAPLFTQFKELTYVK